ncbi:MAG: DUF3422 domain-containing protein [Pseudomonadota bacterium]
MAPITDHPLRYELANELHARPFPALRAPCRAAYLAIKRPENAASRDRAEDMTHLIALLDRYGAPHPQPGATHYFGEIGKHRLKWESHTEFVTYTVFADGVADKPYDAETFAMFPDEWLAAAPGVRMTSALIRVEEQAPGQEIATCLEKWLVPESTAVSEIIDGNAIIAGDFRIDVAGHMRFAVFTKPGIGERRTGRIVQRLCEIETYKSMSMLGLQRARDIQRRITPLEQNLTAAVREMTAQTERPGETLERLLSIAAELENMLAQSSFRFGATGAYGALVAQRIEALREERHQGRQTFTEFMNRRYEPAMRTVQAAETQLATLAQRAMRAADLLRTRVDVDRSAENQKLLESMNRRADLQLRLQRTVEGLSVVAISYYAVNLATYVLGPVGQEIGVSRLVMTALITPLVIMGVWAVVRRIRKVVD